MVLLCNIINAQNKITGKVKDQNKIPLVGAGIYVPEMNKGTVANKDGNYELVNLPKGRIKIQFSFIGYTNRIETVEMKGESVELNIELEQTPIRAEEIVVSGGYNSTQHENAVKIEVLKLNSEGIKSTPNFTEILTQVAGVDMISKGSGVSKPVIRGLGMNDILVLNNSVRYENYQYSSHHPLGIDEFGIDDVEIIKGPASLLYGSDAIGGVVNFIKEKPAPVGNIIGDYNLQLFSNSLGMTNNLGIKGASKKFFGGIRAGQKTNSDYLQGGGDYVPNSRFNEMSVKANAGFTDRIGTFKLFYDFNNQKLGLTEDEAIEEIKERGRENEIWYQEFNTHLLSSQNKLYMGKYKLDVNSAYQTTELIHFGEKDIYEIQMKLRTLTYEAKLHLPAKGNSEYIVGVQGMNQRNENMNEREVKLLPDAETKNYSVFGLLQQQFMGKLKLQAGLRYDYKTISSEGIGEAIDTAAYRAGIEKNYGSMSGSLGGTCNISKELLIRVNLASAYRTPNLAELTSKGLHELRFERGDEGLLPEKSLEADVSMHFHKENFTIDIAGFYNIVNDFIFIAPIGDTTSAGNFIYKYGQANSFLTGGEAGVHFHPNGARWLHMEGTYATVIGKQANGDFLPFIPANKVRFEMRAEKEKFLFMENAFVSVNLLSAMDQNNAAEDETETKGYGLLDLSIGGEVKVMNQRASISIGVNNLFDRKYIDHLSTLKEVNLFNPGRNVSFNLRVPFGIKN